LSDLEGLEVEEVAMVMKLPRTVTRWHLHKARSRLRTELLKEIRPPDGGPGEPEGGKEV
jgi:DNA-directed RNA polymerase specialized sigma24 family protein